MPDDNNLKQISDPFFSPHPVLHGFYKEEVVCMQREEGRVSST